MFGELTTAYRNFNATCCEYRRQFEETRMTAKKRYEADDDTVYEVHPRGGRAIVYDFLGPGEAALIRDLLNRGVGPDWDTLKPELAKLKRRRRKAT
jgi:hypothetical protein